MNAAISVVVTLYIDCSLLVGIVRLLVKMSCTLQKDNRVCKWIHLSPFGGTESLSLACHLQ